jgi:hypothetical protein
VAQDGRFEPAVGAATKGTSGLEEPAVRTSSVGRTRSFRTSLATRHNTRNAGLVGNLRHLGVHRLVAPEALNQRNRVAGQDRMLVGDAPAGEYRLIAVQDPGADSRSRPSPSADHPGSPAPTENPRLDSRSANTLHHPSAQYPGRSSNEDFGSLTSRSLPLTSRAKRSKHPRRS